MNTKRLIILGVILAVLVFGGAMIVYAQANNDQTTNNSLEGVWMGKVTFSEEFGMPRILCSRCFHQRRSHYQLNRGWSGICWPLGTDER